HFDKNKGVDLLVCGDFNDTPQSDSVNKWLRATDDRKVVREARGETHLLNLFMGKDPLKFGTHYYDADRTWFIFDQIVVSPGLLDAKGWSCDPDSAQTVRDVPTTANGHPLRFGNRREMGQRGASDHCPVTVRLQVRK